MSPKGWQVRTLGSVLERAAESIDPQPDVYYREIGIRSHGKGIFHKEALLGKEIGDKRVFKVVPNCFVVNIVFAWEQAVARTTSAEEGMIASHRFPMYRPRKGECDIDFLTYYFKSKKGKHLLELASPGGAGRNKTLGQKEFERLSFPMPSGIEQAAIAGILATWDKAIELTGELLFNSKEEKKALMQLLLSGKKRLPGCNGSWKEVKLGDLVYLNPSRPEKPRQSKVSFIPMDAVSEDARLLRQEERNYADVENGFTAFQNHDVLVAKITPCFENGKGAFVNLLINGIGFGSTEFHVLRARDGVCAKFIYHITNSSEFRVRGEANMQGSAGQKRVPTSYLRSYKLAVPSDFDEQNKIANALDTSDAIVTALTNDLQILAQQKRALMQQLLTGKRRVKLDSAA